MREVSGGPGTVSSNVSSGTSSVISGTSSVLGVTCRTTRTLDMIPQVLQAKREPRHLGNRFISVVAQAQHFGYPNVLLAEVMLLYNRVRYAELSCR